MIGLVLALSAALVLIVVSRSRSRTWTAGRDRRVESLLVRALSEDTPAEAPEAQTAIDDVHSLGERLLGALDAERRAALRLRQRPHDRSQIDCWLACRDAAIRLERRYSELACDAGFQAHSIPRSWAPRVRLGRVPAFAAPRATMRPDGPLTSVNFSVLLGLPQHSRTGETAS
ncbi:MAG TPA: hypothetical protein VGF59_31775 [Bryobacteraceae bacterium]|jgi:hypothetical protein